MKQINIFNIKVNPLSRLDFLALIKSNLVKRTRIVQFGVNSATVNEAEENQEFRRVINSADLLNIDGMSVVWALRGLGYQVPERVATPDLADGVLAMAAEEKFSVFLLGARDEILSLCQNNLKETFPGIIIAGCRNGYFKVQEESLVIDMINSTNPDILLIGMSSPKKEFLIDKYRDRLNARYILGVGGYFDILSGRTKRAPVWMQNNGLEWIFRLIQEPKRMWRRYLIGNNKFFLTVIRERFRKA